MLVERRRRGPSWNALLYVDRKVQGTKIQCDIFLWRPVSTFSVLKSYISKLNCVLLTPADRNGSQGCTVSSINKKIHATPPKLSSWGQSSSLMWHMWGNTDAPMFVKCPQCFKLFAFIIKNFCSLVFLWCPEKISSLPVHFCWKKTYYWGFLHFTELG